MNRFEQLIEYVINDEEQKARELFHDIVVEKSRQIYENIMAEEAEEDLDEAKEEELDEAKDEEELDESADEDIEEGAMGGDAADDLIDDVEMEEESDMSMEAEGDDEGADDMEVGAADDEGAEAGEEELEDRVMDLEDKLDELMAEFEELMGSEAGGDMGDGDDFGADEGGDAIEVDDTEEMIPMAEAVSLKAAPKPVTSEEGGVNKKSTVAANSGAAGMAAKPVHTGASMGGKHDAAGAYSNQTKDLIGDFQNKAGSSMKDLSAATKPHLAQATGVNTKSPLPGGRKG
jgi:hypothetical protein